MKEMVTYLTFDGNCAAAMQFYQAALGGKLQVMRAGDVPPCPLGAEERILHSNIRGAGFTLMASDAMPGMPIMQGNNFWISIDCSDTEEQIRLFTALGEGGNVTMELQDTFWGASFGMLKDKFGVGWMFNLDKSPDQSPEKGTHGAP